MTERSDPETVLRHFEATVLDKFHESLALWKRPRPSAVYAVLAALDSMLLPILFGPDPSHPANAQTIKSIEEGAEYALRWLNPHAPFDIEATPDNAILNEAGEFLLHAKDYSDLADFHMMYGRGQLDLGVEQVSRTITFSTTKADKVDVLMGFIENVHAQTHGFVEPRIGSILKVFPAAARAIRRCRYALKDGHIVFIDFDQLWQNDLSSYFSYFERDDQPYLQDNTDLGGFDAAHLRSTWRCLQRISQAANLLFLQGVLDRTFSQHDGMPTQLYDRGSLVTFIANKTGTDIAVVERIIDRLTFGAGLKGARTSIFLQPLIASPRQIGWSAWVIQNNRYQRNALKLMARTKSLEKLAATIIGNLERPFLLEVSRRLQKYHYQTKIATPISGGDETGEVDLLAYSTHCPEEVLLLEGKALLDVDEINEVDQATRELVRAQSQLEKVLRILANTSEVQKAELFKFVDWKKVKRLYPLVMSPRVEPHNGYDPSQIPSLSFEVLRGRLRAGDLKSPSRIIRAALDRVWLKPVAKDEQLYREIKVGDVTYRTPARLATDV